MVRWTGAQLLRPLLRLYPSNPPRLSRPPMPVALKLLPARQRWLPRARPRSPALRRQKVPRLPPTPRLWSRQLPRLHLRLRKPLALRRRPGRPRRVRSPSGRLGTKSASQPFRRPTGQPRRLHRPMRPPRRPKRLRLPRTHRPGRFPPRRQPLLRPPPRQKRQPRLRSQLHQWSRRRPR